ncbi:MFS transporter [Mytilinidion resinicola]|uniref:MFS transporter n=1 Tax=Mytilinidion resinicola TaxID=574789 RepID=A0A6A6YR47_9PEZI|nr:MFS transporter [Mytilinidion resinicola]KAF2811382.1 MFS transporter [Mytilinidion resinicola]
MVPEPPATIVDNDKIEKHQDHVTTHAAEELNGDKYLAYANTNTIIIDEETNKKLCRKIDMNVLPWLCGLYILQYLDKGVLSYAGVMGIQKENHMTSSEYTWLGSIYYAGYIVAAPIHNRAFQQFSPSKWIAGCVVTWGVVLCCMTACHNWTGLMIQRSFLGALEASINCGFALITAAWYKKHEHGSRVGIWSACTGFATMAGGLIAFGCVAGQQKNPGQYSSWKILALVTGLISVVYGAAMWWWMAPSVVDAKFFTEEERTLAVERLRENHQGGGSQQYKRYQAVEAFTDVRTWMYVLFVLSNQIPSGGLVLLQSILIKNLGFTTKETLLLNIPQGFISILCNAGFGMLSQWTKHRSGAAIGAAVFSLFWAALYVGLGNQGHFYAKYGQLVAYFFMSGSSSTAWFMVISMISSNVLGTTKKTTLNSVVFVTLGAAYFIGPQTFRDPPFYAHAKISLIVLWVVSILVLCAFLGLNVWENGRRERLVGRGDRGEEVDEKGTGNVEFMDLTDKENKLFRYAI